jgi:hypothetical protein
VFGTLFWELAIGNGERCPFWYWLSPGKGVERMTRVDHALDALGLIAVSCAWTRIRTGVA